jgi:TolB-like protein
MRTGRGSECGKYGISFQGRLASGLMTKKHSSLKERGPAPPPSGSHGATAAKPVHLRLLNSFSITASTGEPVVVRGSRAQCILAYLALQPRYTCTRQTLMGLLWGDRGQAQAQASLRMSLSEIRTGFSHAAPGVLVADRDEVRLKPNLVTVDCLDMLRLATELSALPGDAFRWSGDLLTNLDGVSPPFDEWLFFARTKIRGQFCAILESKMREALSQPELSLAANLAECILGVDPTSEVAHRALITHHANMGNIGTALRQYKILRQTLSRLLDATPSRETEELIRSVRAGRYRRDEVETSTLASAPSSVERSLTQQRDKADRAPLALPDKPSIAVLPFTNLSNDSEHELFADGLTEDLIIDLSQAPGLFVIARSSSFAYKGKSVDVRTAARDLGVRYILEGSARRAAGRMRISGQLIDATAGGHPWAERFDRSLDDIFSVLDELVAKIVEALVGRTKAAQTPKRRRPANLEAYDLCVRGRALISRSPLAGREARLLFERAIALDPGFAEAHRWLAVILQTASLWGESTESNRRLALATARKAAELDPYDSGNRWVLGIVLTRERCWTEADAEFAAALQLDPNNADAWAFSSELMVLSGRPAEAIADIHKALRLNPHPPGWYYWFLGGALYLDRQYDQAIETLRREETYRTLSRRTLAASLAQLGRLDEARREAEFFMASNPDFTISQWADSCPFRDEAAGRHFVDGYLKAGLPE